MKLRNKRIAIVGGGPGGLTLARLLQLNGAEVRVYERDHSRTARVQGAIVDLHYDSGLKAIGVAGLLDAFKSRYMPGADRYRILDKNAVTQYDEHQGTSTADFGDMQFRPEIDRGALRDILLDALEPGTVVWDSRFAGMEKHDGGWRLTFADGRSAEADFVVGADGARSKIRPYVTEIIPEYAGVTIIQGEVEHPEVQCPTIHEMMKGGNMSVFGDEKILSVQPRGDGGISFYASSKQPADFVGKSGLDFADGDQIRSFLEAFFHDWNPVFFTLFNSCAQFTVRPLHCVPPDQTWDVKNNITLIGDAAHIMPPSGEGVNLAMLDALDLSECLTGAQFDDIGSAVEAYEKRMRDRASDAVRDAMDMRKWMHGDDALEKMIELLSPRS